jgi:SAM-dependent methyltransferase
VSADYDKAASILQSSTDGARRFFVLLAALELGIFEHIGREPSTVTDVATRADISPRGAQAILDALVALDLISVDAGRYALGEGARELFTRDSARFIGADSVRLRRLTLELLWHPLTNTVRSGAPGHPPDGDEMRAYWQALVGPLASATEGVAEILVRWLGLTEGELRLLDVGGGRGPFSQVLLRENPRARSVQIDLPEINALARAALTSAGLGDRFATVDGDLHTAPLETGAFDVAVLSHILHQSGPESARALLDRVRASLRPGGRVIVVEVVVDDGRGGPASALWFNLQMLAESLGGRAYARRELETLVSDARFASLDWIPVSPTWEALVATAKA